MAIKYYSDVTHKTYDSMEACSEAEKALIAAQDKERLEKEKRATARKEAADKVEVARKNMLVAQRAYRDELEKFCKNYGTYHSSWTSDDIPSLFDFFGFF